MITIRKSDIKWIIICGVIIIALIVLLVIALSGGKNPGTPSASIPASVGVTPSPILPSTQPSPEQSVSPTPAVEYMKVVNIDDGSSLKVRNDASPEGEEIARLNNGAVVELVQRNAAEGWHKIKIEDGTVGFCSADFLEDTAAPAVTPSAGNTEPTPGSSFVKVTADNVNLRKEATTDAESLALLAKDTVLKVLDNNVAGGWYKVETEGGKAGYCKSDYLTASDSGW